MRTTTFLFIPLICLFLENFLLVQALDNGLARIPPMGWLTWERFRCNIDCEHFPSECIGERLMLEQADRLADDGWRDAGYNYITVDDCWMATSRDVNGRLVADKTRFPRGMKYVADYIHSKGLKFGIYEDFGTQTCGGYPGSEFYLNIDANTFADWGVDLVKFDGCNSDIGQQQTGYQIFGDFLNKTGRPMIYSCSYPAYQKLKDIDAGVLQKMCNMWRMFDDIQDSWESVLSIINFYKQNDVNFTQWSAPGSWNDPDMVIIGNYGLSWEQQRSQMAMWAMFPAPLILSVDLRSINNDSKSLLLHKSLLKINQDPLGKPGLFVKEANNMQLWQRELLSGYAVAILNTNTDGIPRYYFLSLNQLTILPKNKNFTAIEVFKQEKIGIFTINDVLPVLVNPSGGVAMIQLIPM